VTYIDSSVALAHIFVENRRAPDALWSEPLTASRLLHYEVWTRVNARQLTRSHADKVRELLSVVTIVEMTPLVLARALEPYSIPMRTLDALHLATIDFLQNQGQRVELATYDQRLLSAARALAIPIRTL
jgi:hypothetical protein